RGERLRTFTVDLSSFYFAGLLWFKLLARLIAFRPHIVYIASCYDWSYLRDAVLMLTARLFGAKVVCHFHGRRSGPLFTAPSGIMRWLLRLTTYSFNKIIFLSEGLKESLLPIFGNGKAEVVSNFVDVRDFRAAELSDNEEARIVFIGRLSDDKGIFELLEAASLLRREGRKLMVDILGVAETDAEECVVQTYATQAGLGAVASFHGIKTGAEKARLLNAATVFVLPSKLEVFPLSLLEAYASGLPAVCVRVGAVPEILKEGENGFLVPPGNTQALVDSLRRILDDTQLRQVMGAKNRSAAESLYSKDQAVRSLSHIFNSLYAS
ncbi:MAG TPA: glycosyltransferase family 4 protein, partial [Pyrinomonadaceae bacterium]|nr:glycosyltransferase family 4 protein [Pyrinomonadaceae bacterium]